MQSTRDQAVAFDYASNLGEYGGMYHDEDVLVVLFTANPAEHELALRDLVAEPDLISVRPAARTWAEVLVAAELARHELTIRPDVCSVGITVESNAFAVTVGLDPYSSLAADGVRAACGPEHVVVREVGPIVRQPVRTAADQVLI